jgi:hypothetical protein
MNTNLVQQLNERGKKILKLKKLNVEEYLRNLKDSLEKIPAPAEKIQKEIQLQEFILPFLQEVFQPVDWICGRGDKLLRDKKPSDKIPDFIIYPKDKQELSGKELTLSESEKTLWKKILSLSPLTELGESNIKGCWGQVKIIRTKTELKIREEYESCSPSGITFIGALLEIASLCFQNKAHEMNRSFVTDGEYWFFADATQTNSLQLSIDPTPVNFNITSKEKEDIKDNEKLKLWALTLLGLLPIDDVCLSLVVCFVCFRGSICNVSNSYFFLIISYKNL